MTLKEAVDYLLDEFHFEDNVYDVKDRVYDDDPDYQGNPWDHISMTRFSEATEAFKKFRNENKSTS